MEKGGGETFCLVTLSYDIDKFDHILRYDILRLESDQKNIFFFNPLISHNISLFYIVGQIS